MDERAIPMRTLLAALCLVFASQAWAANTGAQFGVSLVVRPGTPAVRALATLPVPAGARAMTTDRFGGSYHYAGALPQAVAFYQSAMDAQGYRLSGHRSAADAATLVWERGGERVELQFCQALGTAAATRIVVKTSATSAG